MTTRTGTKSPFNLIDAMLAVDLKIPLDSTCQDKVRRGWRVAGVLSEGLRRMLRVLYELKKTAREQQVALDALTTAHMVEYETLGNDMPDDACRKYQESKMAIETRIAWLNQTCKWVSQIFWGYVRLEFPDLGPSAVICEGDQVADKSPSPGFPFPHMMGGFGVVEVVLDPRMFMGGFPGMPFGYSGEIIEITEVVVEDASFGGHPFSRMGGRAAAALRAALQSVTRTGQA